jgi:chemotaxis protein CheD
MSTPERLTLAERMSLAAERTAAAREGRSTRAPPAHGQGSYWQLPAQPGEDIFLMPGQLHFGHQAASVKTLLGSCVALTLWHPGRKVGGMCHYLLPTRTRTAGDQLDGRYGDEALDVLLQHMRNAGTEPAEYLAHLYGGADTMPEGVQLKFNVGERNIEQGWNFVERWGLQLQGVDVGEDVPRTVKLTLATGEVEMRRGTGRPPPIRLPGTLSPRTPSPRS